VSPGQQRVPATRSNLLLARNRLERVRGGARLLTQKRRALVSELFELVSPAADARVRVGERAATAYPALLEALAAAGSSGLRALGWPSRDIEVTLRSVQVWGLGVAEIAERSVIRRTPAARGTSPASTGPAAVAAADEFETLIELLLDAASREALVRRLGRALAHTSRQLNTLEQRIGPGLERQIAAMGRTLDEREREEHSRLKRLIRARAARRSGSR